jgi:acyl-CoA dehydrogenase
MQLVCLSALPIVYSAYLGVAESAREIALGLAKKKKDDPHAPYLVGEMDNCLLTARIVHASMVELTKTAKPSPDATSTMLGRRTIVAKALMQTVDKALDVAGGSGFYRSSQLERCFRDVQAVRYHPVQEKAQLYLSGRLALGFGLDD